MSRRTSELRISGINCVIHCIIQREEVVLHSVIILCTSVDLCVYVSVWRAGPFQVVGGMSFYFLILLYVLAF